MPTATRKTAPQAIDLDAYLDNLSCVIDRVAVVEEIATGKVLGVYAEYARGEAAAEKGLHAASRGRLACYTDGPDGEPRWTADLGAAPSKVYRTRWLRQRWM